jgi:uncharacterized protein YndB with AHSA1/START domain
MRWVLFIGGGLVALGALVALIGARLPRGHMAASAVTLGQPPESVWKVIRDLGGVTGWWPEMAQVERLPDKDGREMWRQRMKNGFDMPLVVVEDHPPSRLVTRLDVPPNAPFGGTWTYDVAPAAGGTRVRITENGEINNVFFRFMSRFIFGYHGSQDGYLRRLGEKFGEAVTPVHEG